MQASHIDLFLASTHDKFTPQQRYSIRQYLVNVPDERYPLLQSLPYKDPMIILLVSIFVGQLGIDRFLVGDTGLGVLKLITCGGLGIWTLIDWFIIMDRSRQYNYELFMGYVR